MTTYYVNRTHGSASDGGAGTSTAAPWKTVNKVQTELRAGNINAGDSILFACGVTWTVNADGENATHMCILPIASGGSSGTKGNPITFSYYGTGALPLFNMGNLNAGIFFRTGNAEAWGGHYYHFEGLAFTNANGQFGIYGELAIGWTVKHCYFYDTRADPPSFGTLQAKLGSEDWLVEWNLMKRTGGEGIYFSSNTAPSDDTWMVTAQFNTIVEVQGEAVDTKSTCRWARIVGNWAHLCGDYGGGQGNAQMLLDMTGGVVRANFIGQDKPNTKGGIVVGSRTENSVTGTDISVVDNLVRNQRHTAGGIHLYGANNSAYNNTVAACTLNGIRLNYQTGHSHTAHTVEDNLMIGNAGNNMLIVSGSAGTEHLVDYSFYSGGTDPGYDDTTSFTGLVALENQDFTSYKPSANSPLLGAAADNRPYRVTGQNAIGARRRRAFSWSYFADDFETGDLSNWDTQTGTDLSVETDAAKFGTYGFRVEGADTTDRYVSLTGLGDLNCVRVAFWIDVDDFVYPTSNNYAILCETRNGSSSVGGYLQIGIGSGAIGIRQNIFDDADSLTTGTRYDLASGWNWVEWEYYSSIDSTQSEGLTRLWINGAFKEEIIDKNNDTKTVDAFNLGLFTGVDSGLSGHFDIDGFTVDDFVAPLPYDPVLYADGMFSWRFDDGHNLGENRGNGVDLTEVEDSSYPFVFSGDTPTWYTTGSVQFDAPLSLGLLPYFSLSNTDDLPTTRGFTIFFVFNFDNSLDGVETPLFGWGDASSDRGLRVYINTSGQIAIEMSTDGTTWDVETTSDIPVYSEVWNRCAITVGSSGSTQCYINGEARIASPASLSATLNSPTGDFVVGRLHDGDTSDFKGYWSELTIDPATEYSADQVKTWTHYGIEGVPDSLITDDLSGSFSTAGTWSSNSANDEPLYGQEDFYTTAAASGKKATFNLTVNESGDYDVYGLWEYVSDNSTSVPYIVTDSSGVNPAVNMDQTQGDGVWTKVGTYNFTSTGAVEINAEATTGRVHADAIQLREVFTASGAAPAVLLALLRAGDNDMQTIAQNATGHKLSIKVRAVNSTTGAPDETLVYNTSGLAMWYDSPAVGKTTITLATLANSAAAYSSGGFVHIDDGYYRLDLPTAAVSGASDDTILTVGGTSPGVTIIGRDLLVISHPLDTYLGELKTHTDLLTVTGGNLEVDIKAINGSTAPADKMEEASSHIVTGVVDSGSTSTTLVFASTSDSVGSGDRISTSDTTRMVYVQSSAGVPKDARKVTGYTGSTITVSEAWDNTPVAGDKFEWY